MGTPATSAGTTPRNYTTSDDDEYENSSLNNYYCTPEASAFWAQSTAGVELSLPLPLNTRREKHALRDLGAFITCQSRRKRIEVHERNFTPEEKEQFKPAKRKELKFWIKAEVLRCLPPHLRPPPEKICRMRWVLVWKPDKDSPNGRKAKARLVILGYEDPTHDGESCMSPTMTRTTRQLFLQLCAWRRYHVEKGDVS